MVCSLVHLLLFQRTEDLSFVPSTETRQSMAICDSCYRRSKLFSDPADTQSHMTYALIDTYTYM